MRVLVSMGRALSLGSFMFLNRAVEFVIALIMIVPVIAVSLVLMALIRFDTPGLPLVFQKRVGRNERVFTCLKLRTFVIGSEIVATHEAQSNQITALGRDRYLRNTAARRCTRREPASALCQVETDIGNLRHRCCYRVDFIPTRSGRRY